MGKIKSKLIRRTAKSLMNRDLEFTGEFDDNKKVLKDSLPSKKIRNQVAGLISKLKKREKLEEEKMQKATRT